MSEWITYYSIVDTIDSWVDSANAVDNNTGTYATYTGLAMKTMILDTPSASVSSGTISKVEHRIYSSLDDDGVPCKLKISPRFSGGNGTLIDVTNTVLSWSSWIDVTTDANAPGSWAWSDISSMGANVTYWWGSGPAPNASVAVLEIKVTYTPSTVTSNKNIITNYYY